MDTIAYTVPPIKEFRNHVCSCLGYMFTFIGFRKFKNIGVPQLDALLDHTKANTLKQKIEQAGLRPLDISKEEILLCYICHDLMNRLLVTDAGEEIAGFILERVKSGSMPKKFEDYGAHYFKINNHMIQNIEGNLGSDA